MYRIVECLKRRVVDLVVGKQEEELVQNGAREEA